MTEAEIDQAFAEGKITKTEKQAALATLKDKKKK